jgi:hypothetical protein
MAECGPASARPSPPGRKAGVLNRKTFRCARLRAFSDTASGLLASHAAITESRSPVRLNAALLGQSPGAEKAVPVTRSTRASCLRWSVPIEHSSLRPGNGLTLRAQARSRRT